MINPGSIPESDQIEYKITHHYQATAKVPFLPSWLPLTFDLFLHERIRFENFLLDADEGSGLQPFPYSLSYGKTNHLEDPELPEDERTYSGSVASYWSYQASVPGHIMLARDPAMGHTSMLTIEGNSRRPFGSRYDLEDGSTKVNPEIQLEKILYVDPTDPAATFQDLPRELGGETEIRTGYAHRVIEQFIEVLGNLDNLVFMHKDAQDFYDRYVRTKRLRSMSRPPLPPNTQRGEKVDLSKWLY